MATAIASTWLACVLALISLLSPAVALHSGQDVGVAERVTDDCRNYAFENTQKLANYSTVIASVFDAFDDSYLVVAPAGLRAESVKLYYYEPADRKFDFWQELDNAAKDNVSAFSSIASNNDFFLFQCGESSIQTFSYDTTSSEFVLTFTTAVRSTGCQAFANEFNDVFVVSADSIEEGFLHPASTNISIFHLDVVSGLNRIHSFVLPFSTRFINVFPTDIGILLSVSPTLANLTLLLWNDTHHNFNHFQTLPTTEVYKVSAANISGMFLLFAPSPSINNVSTMYRYDAATARFVRAPFETGHNLAAWGATFFSSFPVFKAGQDSRHAAASLSAATSLGDVYAPLFIFASLTRGMQVFRWTGEDFVFLTQISEISVVHHTHLTHGYVGAAQRDFLFLSGAVAMNIFAWVPACLPPLPSPAPPSSGGITTMEILSIVAGAVVLVLIIACVAGRNFFRRHGYHPLAVTPLNADEA
jgi:hypothetical protein